MTILRAYKTELDPNDKQRTFLGRCVGAGRFIYNWALADRKAQHEAGTPTNEYAQRKRFNALKNDQFPWLTELPYAITESAFANLDAAYQNFFRRVKAGKEKSGFPKFKKRRQGGSFQLRNVKIESDRARLTGIGWIKLKERDYIPTEGVGYAVYATISEKADRWFISVQVEEPNLPLTEKRGVVGVDVGIKSLVTCSDGTTFDNPRSYRIYERKLATLQRELARRKKGGANYAKTKTKIARLHKKEADTRHHASHQVSHHVTSHLRPKIIVIEDLDVKQIIANPRIAKVASDASMSELLRQITYKAGWQGIEVIEADRQYPSSKMCSKCGTVVDDFPLARRKFTCPKCGLVIDRDLNAAINLAALGEPSNGRGLLGELGRSNASL